jgi:hypothetical protein
MSNLTDAADLFRSILGQTRPKHTAILKALTDEQISHSVFMGKDKANKPQPHYLLDEAGAAKLAAFLEARQRAASQPTSPAPASAPGIAASVESLRTDQAALLDMVSELSGTVDTLHKAVEHLQGTYADLLKGMDPKDRERMPAVVKLPTHYKWKVVIAGGHSRMFTTLEERFHMLRLVHIAPEGQRPEMSQRQSLPAADLCLMMCSAISHENAAKAVRFYGKDKIVNVNGSLSSAEAALTAWLHEREAAA